MASPSHSRTIKRGEETKQNRGISPPTRFIPWFTQEQCPSGQERQIFNADLRHNQVWSKKGVSSGVPRDHRRCLMARNDPNGQACYGLSTGAPGFHRTSIVGTAATDTPHKKQRWQGRSPSVLHVLNEITIMKSSKGTHKYSKLVQSSISDLCICTLMFILKLLIKKENAHIASCLSLNILIQFSAIF